MRLHVILRYIGMIVLLNAVFMLISVGISIFSDMDSGFYPLLLSFLLTSALGAFPMLFVGRSDAINNKEGYAIVVGAWIISCMVATFPYLLWGGEFNFSTAWFESVSGYTTTGATALNDVEALPRGLLFWRASTHWLGGVGVVMFALVVLPSMARTKMTLSSLEMSSLAKDNYKYRTHKTVQILLVVYIGMTVIETIMLKFAGMTWFDAVCHAFSTVATGGFSTRNQSVAYYNNYWIEIIITVFMVLSGLHFGLIFATVTGKMNNIFRSEVSRFYMLAFAIGSLVVGVSIWLAEIYPSFATSIRYASFQVASVLTTTGFASADSTVWTPLAITLLMMFTIQCACAGSTSGGLKSDRVWLAFKVIKAKILQQQHPNAVITVKLNNVVQDKSSLNFVMLFFVAYVAIIMVSTVVLTAAGADLLSSFSMTIATLGNVGPGFGEVGSMCNYSVLTPFMKGYCSFLMLLGRLEIFGLIQLFMFKWWK